MAVLKYSRQREAIKNYLQGREDHPSADMVYDGIRGEFPEYQSWNRLQKSFLINRAGRDHQDPDRRCGSF